MVPLNRPILFLTFDGVLQPLAFSQVVRVVTALARGGFVYRLLSVERTQDLADLHNVARVKRVLSDACVAWTWVGVDLNHSARRSGEAFARCLAHARSIVRRDQVALIHARGYQGGAVANVVRRLTGIPYLFDARGCWIDEKTDWFARPAMYAAGKFAERHLYAEAEAVVTLTDLHARDVIDGSFGRRSADRVMTIPTCADYDEFRLQTDRQTYRAPREVVPLDVQRRLAGQVILAIVGALNRSYLPGPTLSLVKHACETRRDVHLLVLTQQRAEYEKLLSAAAIGADRFTVTSARHDDMPTWLNWVDWGLLLLTDTISKRGSMPTKLAEFFAAGVRPVAHGCNSEMTDWVRRAGSGIVLDEVAQSSLRAAALELTSCTDDFETLRHAREITEPHFSLLSGVERYANLLRGIL
jgi:hypothetical protein